MARKRLGIFVFYNSDGYVNRYVEYLLDDIIKNISHLIIVCNGQLDDRGREIFSKYTKDIKVRKNEGYDSCAFKEILEDYLGFHKLQEWDELLLFNDTFYGPIYPFKEVFDKMESVDTDFWGLALHGVIDKTNIPEHIQSYFLVFRSQLIHSIAFEEFWQGIKVEENVDDVIANYECQLTNYFKTKGFKETVLCDVVAYEKENGFAHCNWSGLKPVTLMNKYNFPIIKKKAFFVQNNAHEYGRDILNCLEKKTDYPTELIWEDMINTYNVDDVQSGLGLEYIRGDISYSNDKITDTAVFIHLYYEDTVEGLFDYIREIPSEIDVYISTANENTLLKIEECAKEMSNVVKIILLENRGRDIAALLVGLKPYIMKYDIFCFMHDKKSTKAKVVVEGEMFRDTLWDNLLKSEGYIRNLMQIMREYSHLALLVPPYPISAESKVARLADAYGDNYENMRSLANRLDIKERYIDRRKKLLSLGTCFWCKTKALKPLFDIGLTLEDFDPEPLPNDNTISHAIERILPFVVQKEGYATGVVEHLETLEKRIVRERDILRTNTILSGLSCIRKPVIEYINSKNDCYLYGNGLIGKKIALALYHKDISHNGHIVTKKKQDERDLLGNEVYGLDDIVLNKDDGIIIAVGEDNTKDIEKTLESRGITDYYTLFK